ncbi:uncharacterized protein N7483_001349 [Penicillium malachiteum]|uniref:uncharacterized protein n=1 Tax=Penicillium malachiteum TaxID=1324776 RepID=UPI0025476C4F|nr:uncharacterized protein N7483_001349 [Penicillium malachiteum]KAJ5736224.1 hypothetical protein N7483_001349 [Penicillium malachiteum]
MSKDTEAINSQVTYDTTTQPGDVQAGELKDHESNYDAVFGEITEDGPNFRSMGWLGAIALMLKTQIGLGVLSIPSVFDTLGIVPGSILLCVVAGIATWTSYMVGIFKLNHREVYGIDDAAGLMFDWVFNGGSGILSLSIGLNAVSKHAACTAVFVVVSAIIGFAFTSIRTLSRITFLVWVGLACILTAVLTVTVAVGVQDGPSTAPQGWTSDYKLFNSPSFADGVSAVSGLIFVCSATPAYFSIFAEMQNPQLFTRALVISQFTSTVVYLIVGVVVYYYCGSTVASPALGTAATTAIFLHYPSKYVFVRVLRGSVHLTSNSLIHWMTWLCCTGGCTIISYIIASGIPVFSDLVSLIGALLGFALAYQPTGCMWFYDNWRRTDRDWKWVALACWSGFTIVVGSFMTVAGTYGSIFFHY